MSVFHRPDSILEGRIAEIKAEIAGRDYQVIKAAREGVPVDDLYPEHTAWYEKQIAALKSLEEEAEKNK
jgi:MinD-like ATPase involved in chromosome partitioning or flagellar assembly